MTAIKASLVGPYRLEAQIKLFLKDSHGPQ